MRIYSYLQGKTGGKELIILKNSQFFDIDRVVSLFLK